MSSYLDDIYRLQNEQKTIKKSLEQLLSDFADLNVKVVNLANKLEEHMKESDAHNPAMMHKKKNK